MNPDEKVLCYYVYKIFYYLLLYIKYFFLTINEYVMLP